MKFAMWKRSIWWLVSVLVLLILTSGLAFLLAQFYHRWQMDRKESVELDNIMMSLNRLPDNSAVYREKQEEIMVTTVQRVFPWLPKNNTLPNYFFHQPVRKSPVSYQRSNIVFMSNSHDASAQFTDCLHSTAMEHSLPMSPFMSSRNRRAWEEAEASERVLNEKIRIHRGNYAFGMCENLTNPCSYFLLLQDPLERAVSTYHYCKNSVKDELCSVMNANKVSVHDWAVHQGSMFFRQLLFQPKFCDLQVNVSLVEARRLNVQKLPCWYKQKLYFDMLSSADVTEAVNYVNKNLEHWFSVIGHVAEYSDSVKMFEHVYRLPFSKCHSDSLSFSENNNNNNNNYNNLNNNNDYNSNDNNNNNIYNNYNNRAYSTAPSPQTLNKQELYILKQNVAVQKALYADYRIYKEAKKLYQIQRQVIFNQIGH
ncbi:uncharacterized protein LOC115223527 [Argonauta hians]